MRNLKKVLALVLVFAMMLSTCVVASAASFPDVEAGYQYTEAIDLLASLNILGGYQDGTFKPENNITRAEFAKVVYVIFNGMDDVNAQMYVSDSQFNDVAKNQWFNGHVNWASENSIVGGYGDGTFLPSNNVAVKEAIKMVVTAVTDKALTYPNGYIQEARALKLLKGVEITSTDAPATRGQVAQLAYNLLFTPSRLCLVDEGTMDLYGNEIYTKTAPVDFVFDLDAVDCVTLDATYENKFTSNATNLEEGQVQLSVSGEGNVLPAGATYDYAGDANDLFGQTLKAYFNADKELVALVSMSGVVEVTTADKLVGGTTKTPYGKIMGEYITYDADPDEMKEKLVRDYGVKNVIEQDAQGVYVAYNGTKVTKEGTNDSYILLKDFYDADHNNEAGKVTLIDTPEVTVKTKTVNNDTVYEYTYTLDGVVDTVIIEHEYKAQVTKYTASTKTIRFGNKTVSFDDAIGHEAFANADYTTGADPVYATYTVKVGTENTVYTLVPTTTVEGVLTSTDDNKGQVVVGGTTYSAFGTATTITNATKNEISDTVKLYMSASGYVVGCVVTKTDSVYDLNLGKVIAASDSADDWGNNVKATITVVTPDGTEKVLTIDTTKNDKVGDEVECDFDGETAKKWLKATGTSSDADAKERYFDYTLDDDTSDGDDSDYTIVGNYIHYEVDDTTNEVVRVVALGDINYVGKDDPANVQPSNSNKIWTIQSFNEVDKKLCYKSDLGFYTASDDKGEAVTGTLGLPADAFVGMYYEENDEGELETAYYTASNIPTFANKGEFTLVWADDDLVAMVMHKSPDAVADNKVLGIVTGCANVTGETEKNGKSTYRIEITMLVNGETQKFYTEDVMADNLPETKWVSLEETPFGIATNQLAYLALLSNGKVAVGPNEDDEAFKNAGAKEINIDYVEYGELKFAYATAVRGSYVTATEVTAWSNAKAEGWVIDPETNDQYYNKEIAAGSVTSGSAVKGPNDTTPRVCNETTYVTISGTPVDLDDGKTLANAGLFQETAASKLTAGGEIIKSDVNMNTYYIFAYTTFGEGEAVDSNNEGAFKTVFIFDTPIDTTPVE